jgi:hypothetical protein
MEVWKNGSIKITISLVLPNFHFSILSYFHAFDWAKAQSNA